MGNRCADHLTPSIRRKLALTSPTGGGRSVGIVRSRTKATEFSFMLVHPTVPESVRKEKFFGHKRDEVTDEWRKVHNEELNDLYCSPIIVRVIKLRRMRWAVHVARMGERRSVYRVSVWKPEGKRPLGKPRRRWEDNIKMDFFYLFTVHIH